MVVSILEHHSNLIPWRQVCRATGAVLEFCTPDRDGKLTQAEIAKKLCPALELVALTHVSNVLGLISPSGCGVQTAHAVGAVCVLDAAQARRIWS